MNTKIIATAIALVSLTTYLNAAGVPCLGIHHLEQESSHTKAMPVLGEPQPLPNRGELTQIQRVVLASALLQSKESPSPALGERDESMAALCDAPQLSQELIEPLIAANKRMLELGMRFNVPSLHMELTSEMLMDADDRGQSANLLAEYAIQLTRGVSELLERQSEGFARLQVALSILQGK